MSSSDLIERSRGFVCSNCGHDDAIHEDVADQLEAQQAETTAHEHTIESQWAEIARLRSLVTSAMGTLGEINPSNYDYDDVCDLNDKSVEAYSILATALGQKP